MVRVRLWGSLRTATGGATEIDVKARNFKELKDELSERFPDLRPQIERGVSLAVDGRVYRDAWFTSFGPDSEVVLMPYMAGG